MKTTMLKRETNNWNITVDSVVTISTDDGDTLLVELPPQSTELPHRELEDMYTRVALAFEEVFADKDVKVIVVPNGMEVKLIKSSGIDDK